MNTVSQPYQHNWSRTLTALLLVCSEFYIHVSESPQKQSVSLTPESQTGSPGQLSAECLKISTDRYDYIAYIPIDDWTPYREYPHHIQVKSQAAWALLRGKVTDLRALDCFMTCFCMTDHKDS